MKTIKFTQKTEVIETYEIEYTADDFAYDCNAYQIENFSYEDLCDIMENEKEVFITVTEYHYDTNIEEWVNGPHMVDAFEFFALMMDDQAYDAGPWDSETTGIYSRDIQVEEKDDSSDNESYPC